MKQKTIYLPIMKTIREKSEEYNREYSTLFCETFRDNLLAFINFGLLQPEDVEQAIEKFVSKVKRIHIRNNERNTDSYSLDEEGNLSIRYDSIEDLDIPFYKAIFSIISGAYKHKDECPALIQIVETNVAHIISHFEKTNERYLQPKTRRIKISGKAFTLRHGINDRDEANNLLVQLFHMLCVASSFKYMFVFKDIFNDGFQSAYKKYFADDFSQLHLDALNQIAYFCKIGDSNSLSRIVPKYEESLAAKVAEKSIHAHLTFLALMTSDDKDSIIEILNKTKE